MRNNNGVTRRLSVTLFKPDYVIMMSMSLLSRLFAGIGALVALSLCSLSLQALDGPADLRGELAQCGLVLGHVSAGTRVKLDGESVPVADDGRFLLGFDRDAEPTARLLLSYPDGRRSEHTLAVRQRDWDIQRIDGLPDRQVTPPPEVLDRIRRESEQMQSARDSVRETPVLYSDMDFAWPLTGRISGVYGSQRILNGEPKRPHFGLDIAAGTGTPIRAPAAGVVVFTHPDMYFNGATVLLDHGLGLSSVFIHMSRIDVDSGDRVDRGEVIGAVGKSGRATGPHLHWGMHWHDRPIDPQLLLGSMPE